MAAIANGGFLMTPTFLKRTEAEAREKATQVLSPQTSEAMRYIMRLNATEGSAKKAAIPYYYVGGKTGTAEKVIRGRYVKNRLFTTFMAAAPMDKPKYLFVTVMDEPQPVAAESGPTPPPPTIRASSPAGRSPGSRRSSACRRNSSRRRSRSR